MHARFGFAHCRPVDVTCDWVFASRCCHQQIRRRFCCGASVGEPGGLSGGTYNRPKCGIMIQYNVMHPCFCIHLTWEEKHRAIEGSQYGSLS